MNSECTLPSKSHRTRSMILPLYTPSLEFFWCWYFVMELHWLSVVVRHEIMQPTFISHASAQEFIIFTFLVQQKLLDNVYLILLNFEVKIYGDHCAHTFLVAWICNHCPHLRMWNVCFVCLFLLKNTAVLFHDFINMIPVNLIDLIFAVCHLGSGESCLGPLSWTLAAQCQTVLMSTHSSPLIVFICLWMSMRDMFSSIRHSVIAAVSSALTYLCCSPPHLWAQLRAR